MSANPLYTALLAAQRAMGPVKKDATNPAFRTKYATLQSVLETIEGPLSDNGLVLLQRFEPSDGGPVLITEIVHAETGDRISSALPVVSKDPTDPQKLGGAITYARRYSLLALLGLAPEDDDGQTAAQPRQQATTQPARPMAQIRPTADGARAIKAPTQLAPNNAPAPVQQATAAPDAAHPNHVADPDMDWNQLWPYLKGQGIKDRAALDAYVGQGTLAWEPAEIYTAVSIKKEQEATR